MKTHPSSREHFKTNKIFSHNFNNEVNESEIHASSVDQVQQVINKDSDLVFDTLVWGYFSLSSNVVGTAWSLIGVSVGG